MQREKCKYCGRRLYDGESMESHLEVCGMLDESEVEQMGEDYGQLTEEERIGGWPENVAW